MILPSIRRNTSEISEGITLPPVELKLAQVVTTLATQREQS